MCVTLFLPPLAQISSAGMAKVAAVPPAPQATSVTTGNATISVSWKTPENGGSRILGYQMTAQAGTARPVSACTSTLKKEASPLATCVVSKLRNGTKYHLAIAARNKAGHGPPLLIVATPGVQDPVISDGNGDPGSTPPSDPGSPPTGVATSSDTTAPVITSWSVDKPDIDTTSGPQVLTWTITATDDSSGIATMELIAPQASLYRGDPTLLNGWSNVARPNNPDDWCGQATLVNGDQNNGTYQILCTIPQGYSEDFGVYGVVAWDNAGNWSPWPDMTTQPFVVSVHGNGDVTPPVIDTSGSGTGITMSPTFSASDGTITGTFHATDPSGVDRFEAVFGSDCQCAQIVANQLTLVSGTPEDGIFRFTAGGFPPGRYTLDQLEIGDTLHNLASTDLTCSVSYCGFTATTMYQLGYPAGSVSFSVVP